MGNESQAVQIRDDKSAAVATEAQGIAPVVQMLMSGNATPETIEKMMDLQDRWEKGEALKAYNAAMTDFRSAVRGAKRSGFNSHLKNYYVTFDDLLASVNGPLGRAGFNYSFSQQQDGKNLTVTCTITHAGGHSESTSLTAEVEQQKGINGLQALGLTASYLNRYTLRALTGVGTEDSDGELPVEAPAADMIDESDMANLQALCDEVGKDYSKLLEWVGTKLPVVDGLIHGTKNEYAGIVKSVRKSTGVSK